MFCAFSMGVNAWLSIPRSQNRLSYGTERMPLRNTLLKYSEFSAFVLRRSSEERYSSQRVVEVSALSCARSALSNIFRLDLLLMLSFSLFMSLLLNR